MPIATSPLRPRIPVPATPARAPCQCVPGTLCAACLAHGERPPPVPSRDALRRQRQRLRDRLPREEARLAEVLAARPEPVDEGYQRCYKKQWETLKRVRLALRVVEARLQGEWSGEHRESPP